MNLNEIVKQLEETELSASEVPNIIKMVNSDGQDALCLAASLGYAKAFDKLLEPIYEKTQQEFLEYGQMVRQAEIGESGISTIKNEPEIVNRTVTSIHYFDVFKKDNLGKSPFDYAFFNKNKKMMAIIYKKCNDLRLYAVKYGNLDGLKYYISELDKARQNNMYDINIVDIINQLSNIDKIVQNIDGTHLALFAKQIWEYSNYPENYNEIFRNLISKAPQEALDLCFNISVIAPSQYNMHNSISIIQPELLKSGASITKKQIETLKSKINSSDDKIKAEFDELYTIDPNDFKTVVGKPKQVIEMYFEKKCDDVFKEYIDKGLVDYDSLILASQCRFDKNGENLPLTETRIGLLARLGANLTMENELGESLFSRLDEYQIVDVMQNSSVQLTDKDVLAISLKSFAKKRFQFEQVDKVYKAVVQHQVAGDIEKYKQLISKSNIMVDLLNIANLYGVEELYDLDLDFNLNQQLKARLEEEKKKISTLQEAKSQIEQNISELDETSSLGGR